MPESLACGCIPLVGGGMRSLCPAAAGLWLDYLDAIESDPANRERWAPLEDLYLTHTNQLGVTA